MTGLAAIGAAWTAIGAIGGAVIGGMIQGAIIGAAIGGITAAVTGGDIMSGVLFGAVGGAVAGGISGYLGGAGTAAGGATTTTSGGVTTTTYANSSVALQAAESASNAGTLVSAGGSTVSTNGASSSALGGLSDSAWKKGADLVKDVGGAFYQHTMDEKAAIRATEEAALNRDLERELSKDRLTASLASTSGSSGPSLAEQIALADRNYENQAKLNEAQYKATAGLSEAESGRRIEEYGAQVAANEEALSQGRTRSSDAILGITGATQGTFVDKPLKPNGYVAPTGILDEVQGVA